MSDGYDSNDAYELSVRFLSEAVSNLYYFRFELTEPLIDQALQETENGFCDYGFCDEKYFVLVPYVRVPEAAVQSIVRVLEANGVEGLESIWLSEKGVPVRQLFVA